MDQQSTQGVPLWKHDIIVVTAGKIHNTLLGNYVPPTWKVGGEGNILFFGVSVHFHFGALSSEPVDGF